MKAAGTAVPLLDSSSTAGKNKDQSHASRHMSCEPSPVFRSASFPLTPHLCLLEHLPGESVQDGSVPLISTAGSKSLTEFAPAAQPSRPELPGENLPHPGQAGGGQRDLQGCSGRPVAPQLCWQLYGSWVLIGASTAHWVIEAWAGPLLRRTWVLLLRPPGLPQCFSKTPFALLV